MTPILLTQQTPSPQQDMGARSRNTSAPAPERSFEHEIARNVSEKSRQSHSDADRDTKGDADKGRDHTTSQPAPANSTHAPKTSVKDGAAQNTAKGADTATGDATDIALDPSVMLAVGEPDAIAATGDSPVLSTQAILQHRLALDPQNIASLVTAQNGVAQGVDTLTPDAVQQTGPIVTPVIALDQTDGILADLTQTDLADQMNADLAAQAAGLTPVVAAAPVLAQPLTGGDNPTIDGPALTTTLSAMETGAGGIARPTLQASLSGTTSALAQQTPAQLGSSAMSPMITADEIALPQAQTGSAVQPMIMAQAQSITPQIDLSQGIAQNIASGQTALPQTALPQAEPITPLTATDGPSLTIVPQTMATSTPMAVSQPSVTVNTTQPVWTGQFVDHISQNIRDGIEEFEIKLSPDKLGPVTIKVDLRGDVTNVQIVTQTADASRLFNDTQDRLSAMLAQSGLDLGQHSAQTGQEHSGAQSGGGSEPAGDITATAQPDGPTENARATDPDALIDILA